MQDNALFSVDFPSSVCTKSSEQQKSVCCVLCVVCRVLCVVCCALCVVCCVLRVVCCVLFGVCLCVFVNALAGYGLIVPPMCESQFSPSVDPFLDRGQCWEAVPVLVKEN